MTTGRFNELFRTLAERKEGAFVPFVTVCDPDGETTLRAMEALLAGGADAFELGIPFSDPVADGPVIEESAHRALRGGATPEKCFEVIARFRAAHPDVPLCAMTDVNLAAVPGAGRFMQAAAEAGLDAVLLPNLPKSMIFAEPEWKEAALEAGIDLVAIVPPNADDQAVREIAGVTGSYTYLLSRAGITGTDKAAERPAERIIRDLEEAGAPAPLLGFGVSEPEHVRAAIAAGAKGVIVGTAVVKRIAEHLDDAEAMEKALASYAREMKSAAKKTE